MMLSCDSYWLPCADHLQSSVNIFLTRTENEQVIVSPDDPQVECCFWRIGFDRMPFEWQGELTPGTCWTTLLTQWLRILSARSLTVLCYLCDSCLFLHMSLVQREESVCGGVRIGWAVKWLDMLREGERMEGRWCVTQQWWLGLK